MDEITATGPSRHAAGDMDGHVTESIISKLPTTSPMHSESSIFRVPVVLLRHNKSAYEPVLVSIGPSHHGKQELQPMEELKLWYLQGLLNQVGRTTITPQNAMDLEVMVTAVRQLEERAYQSYADPIKIGIDRDKFIEMMVVDGCFIIELFLRSAGKVIPQNDDPILSMPWMLDNLRHDLILLENQLPWCVLDMLFNQVVPQDEKGELCELVNHSLSFLHHTLPIKAKPPLLTKTTFLVEPKHLLDLLYCTIVHSNVENGSKLVISKPSPNPRSSEGNSTSVSVGKAWEPIPCVIDLAEAGVRFKKGSDSNILNVDFTDGVLRIPPLIIYEPTECLFRNLIALEQSHHEYQDKLASYVLLLDGLIDTPRDVHLLCGKGIIDNWLGSEEDVSNLFNKLRCDVSVYNFFHAELCEKVKNYSNTRRHQWLATFRHDYCNTPWKILSLSAATILLILTLIQAVFSVLSYHPHA